MFLAFIEHNSYKLTTWGEAVTIVVAKKSKKF